MLYFGYRKLSLNPNLCRHLILTQLLGKCHDIQSLKSFLKQINKFYNGRYRKFQALGVLEI